MNLVRSLSNSPSYNLALEEMLFAEYVDDFLLFYINAPSVILGSNQAVQNEVDSVFCAQNEVAVVRRKSGGGAVYHDMGNLNFSFIRTNSDNSMATTADFLIPVVSWLAEMGVSVHIGERKDLWTADGFKVSGTASRVRKNRVLQHGTLLFDTNQQMLAGALAAKDYDMTLKATASVRSKTKNLRSYFETDAVPVFEMASFATALLTIVGEYYATQLKTNLDFEQEKIYQLAAFYRQPEWTYKK